MKIPPSGAYFAIVAIIVVTSATAILMSHTDELYALSGAWSTPFLDLMRNTTDCGMKPVTDSGNCVQVARQMKSLIAAMVAALLTILSVTAAGRSLTLAFGVAAGASALKAVYHQTMYIADGNVMLPILILVVASFPSIGIAIGFLWELPRRSKGEETP